ncbi:uncharacterized protein PHACADRAFT_213278 [Phanerochaete carnosa HHB-10118-sp]|uniref:Uncharacterized protein n=1 Tax=Phanerochaete carnosa (strain HHB-10118-sp) TaxID=650164 RepID=K5VXY1_PHACS|nr:uncharacterized protein PHACADRAFT_213278 [Phanerochaete carnosa HHB-10118-sp]EKM51454.1 hypothetical protein PHACADRAFT_213278 [Phanerochaete carnosa HHB-10118-sp]
MFDDPETCIRFDIQHADEANLLNIVTQIAIATYKQCAASPPRALDGHRHWAVLHYALRTPPARPYLWLMFWERVEHATGAGQDAGQNANAPREACHFVVDLAWHILHDRATNRFHRLLPEWGPNYDTVREHGRQLLLAQHEHGCERALAHFGGVTSGSLRRRRSFGVPLAVELPPEPVMLNEGKSWESWRHGPAPEPIPRVEEPIEFPDQEEGYDGQDPYDLPGSDDDLEGLDELEWVERLGLEGCHLGVSF